jgi:hypothetical protein
MNEQVLSERVESFIGREVSGGRLSWAVPLSSGKVRLVGGTQLRALDERSSWWVAWALDLTLEQLVRVREGEALCYLVWSRVRDRVGERGDVPTVDEVLAARESYKRSMR